MPPSFWIIALALMIVILILQDSLRFSTSDLWADLIDDAGFYVVLVIIVAIGVFTVRDYHRSGHLPWRSVRWVVMALICWWIFFNDTLRNRSRD